MFFLDRRFLTLSLAVLAVADEPDANPAAGSQYIVGSNPTGAFASASTNQIARYNGSAWTFFSPKIGELEVLNLDTGYILQFNGSAWTAVASFSLNSASDSAVLAFFTEAHSLTADDVSAKTFTLTHSIASGQESNTLLFVSGLAQTVGSDFTASGNSISWNNKGLDSIGLTVGDSFLIQYVKA